MGDRLRVAVTHGRSIMALKPAERDAILAAIDALDDARGRWVCGRGCCSKDSASGAGS
jgi:hypothetical protein